MTMAEGRRFSQSIIDEDCHYSQKTLTIGLNDG
mgnify:CR=1 FL=1